jgi:large subunit ribosomal protein L35
MPSQAANKQKTVSGAKKRFRISGSGSSVNKIRRRAAFRSHNLGKQERKRLDQKIGGKVVSKRDTDRVKRMLGEG